MSDSKWKFLVEVNAGGRPIRLSQSRAEVPDALGAKTRAYLPALSQLTVPELGQDSGEAAMVVPETVLDVSALQRAGIQVAGAPAEVSLWREGDDWWRRFVLLNGYVKADGVERLRSGHVTLKLSDGAWKHDPPFPPWTMEPEDFPQASRGAWASGTTYDLGDVVLSNSRHYVSIVGDNAANDPGSSAAYWSTDLSGRSGLNSSAAGSSFPALYGRHLLAPLIQVTKLDDSFGATSLVRFVIAGHRVRSTQVVIKPGGDKTRSFTAAVQYAPSRSGAWYAYCEVQAQYVRGAGTLVCEVDGYPAESGDLLQGLGDVFQHAIKTFGRLADDRIDVERMARFQGRANMFAISSAFGGDHGDAFVGTWKSRMESSLPVLISWRGGKLGADVLSFDPNAKPGRSLKLGAELIGRDDPVAPDLGEVFSTFRAFYAPSSLAQDERGPKRTANISIGPGSSEVCDEALSCWGEAVCQPFQIFEVNSKAAAYAALSAWVDVKAVQRTRVSYDIPTDVAIRLPIYERYPVTDARWGWVAEDFRLERLAVQVDNPAMCTGHFRSFRGNRRMP